MLGGALFYSWEGWSFVDGSYFCFVTLSTIGFGDMIPGESMLLTDPRQGHKRLALSVLYIVVGLSLISMCLNLAYEQVIMKLRRFAAFFGLGPPVMAVVPPPEPPRPPVRSATPSTGANGGPDTVCYGHHHGQHHHVDHQPASYQTYNRYYQDTLGYNYYDPYGATVASVAAAPAVATTPGSVAVTTTVATVTTPTSAAYPPPHHHGHPHHHHQHATTTNTTGYPDHEDFEV